MVLQLLPDVLADSVRENGDRATEEDLFFEEHINLLDDLFLLVFIFDTLFP